jgi:hypothetical protein
MGRGSPVFLATTSPAADPACAPGREKGNDVIRKTGFWAALLALVVMGCAGHEAVSKQDKQDGKTFWTHRYQHVRLVPQDHCPGQETAANSHPQDLDGGRLRAALESLYVNLPEQQKTAPVFTRRELDRVTGPLLQAFKKAAPDEDVALVVEGMHPGEYGLQRCIVTARLFVNNGDQLNVIFNKLHVPVNDYDTPMGMEPTDYRLDPFVPGSRCEKAGKKFPAIIANNVARFHGQDGVLRKNWMTVSLAAQPQPVPTPAPVVAPPAYQASPPPTIQAPPQTVPPAYQAPRQTAPPAAQDANRMAPAPAQQPAKTILERLQILKDLRVKGLITEQEYQEKKKEILNSL